MPVRRGPSTTTSAPVIGRRCERKQAPSLNGWPRNISWPPTMHVKEISTVSQKGWLGIGPAQARCCWSAWRMNLGTEVGIVEALIRPQTSSLFVVVVVVAQVARLAASPHTLRCDGVCRRACSQIVALSNCRRTGHFNSVWPPCARDGIGGLEPQAASDAAGQGTGGRTRTAVRQMKSGSYRAHLWSGRVSWGA